MKSELRQALYLWANRVDDPITTASQLRNCQIAVDLFLCGKLPLSDYLEIIADQGVDMDDYAQIVEENLIVLGF